MTEWYDQAYDSFRGGIDWFKATLPRQWLLFFLLLIGTWFVAHVGSRIVTRRLVRLRRVEPAVVQLLGTLFVLLTVLVATFVYSKAVFPKANVAGLAATLGLVSLALGFGFQNTIANVAGGISLALDRPFRLGDQIRVGDFVGDVQEIGIRSTRILTRRKEYIVLPNKYLESEPITNFTMVYPEFRLDVPINVSTQADRQHVEDLLIEVALSHPVVLRRPAPRVLVRRFLGTILHLELRCWISHPRDRTLVESDLLKSIHDRFVYEGIVVPGVQPSDGKKHPRPRAHSFVRTPAATRRLLVPLFGTEPSTTRANYAVALAKALRGQIVGVYVLTSRRPQTTAEEGGRSLHVLETMASEAGIWFKPILRETDDPADAILDACKEEDVDVVVLGVGRSRTGVDWAWWKEPPVVKAGELRQRGLSALVHEVPESSRLNPRQVEELNAELTKRDGPPKSEPTTPVVVSPPEPRTSAVPAPPPESAKEHRSEAAPQDESAAG